MLIQNDEAPAWLLRDDGKVFSVLYHAKEKHFGKLSAIIISNGCEMLIGDAWIKVTGIIY
jgi:hypothetical protein